MALEWQFVPVKFGGLDTKTDDKNIVPGSFTTLQNLWMDKTARLQKRYGTSAVGFAASAKFAVSDIDGDAMVYERKTVKVVGAGGFSPWPFRVDESRVVQSASIFTAVTARSFALAKGTDQRAIGWSDTTAWYMRMVDSSSNVGGAITTTAATPSATSSGFYMVAGYNHPTDSTFGFVVATDSSVTLYRAFSMTPVTIHNTEPGYAEKHRCFCIGDYCLLYTSPSPRDGLLSRMPSSA